jgi:hypothetical protein
LFDEARMTMMAMKEMREGEVKVTAAKARRNPLLLAHFTSCFVFSFSVKQLRSPGGFNFNAFRLSPC